MLIVMAKRGPKNPMSDSHKAAMAAGRTEGKAVRDYLEALKANKPKRGRKRTIESVRAQLFAVETALASADPIRELQLVQKRMDLVAELASFGTSTDISALETAFVAVAKSYSERNGISYAAWREIGLDPSVLKAAGITRSS